MSGWRFGLSLHPSTVGWRVAWPALAELAAESGYEGAVIPRDQPLPAVAKGSVRATAMQLPVETRRDDATFWNTLPRLRPAAAFAAEAGCRVALLGVPPSAEQPRAVQEPVYRERWKRCCEVLDEYGIRLALECITPLDSRRAHPYEFIWRNEEMLEFGLTVSPQCGLILDSWHWHHAGGEQNWIRNVPADRILDVHISDSPDVPPEDIRDLERVLPGEGVVDFAMFLNLLAEKKYREPLAVEIMGRRLGDREPGEAARLAFGASAAVLKKTGFWAENAISPGPTEV